MNLMQRLLRRPLREASPARAQRLELVDGSARSFTTWSGDPWKSDIFRAGVSAIATHASKLEGAHMILDGDRSTTGDPRLNRLLQVEPNPCMPPSAFLHKMAAHLYERGNSFALIDREPVTGRVVALWPIDAAGVEFLADASGALFCRFRLTRGEALTAAYQDVAHLRRSFNRDPLLGDDNSALDPTLAAALAQNEGIPYNKWMERGLLRLCAGNKINYSDVTAWFLEMVREHGITPGWIFYDNYSARYWTAEMEAQGFRMVRTQQGAKTLSLPMQQMGLDLQAKRINYNDNPILKWCLTNTGVQADRNGNVVPVKQRNPRRRIDGTASLLDAYVGLLEHYDELKNA